jgi:hypothetical protein
MRVREHTDIRHYSMSMSYLNVNRWRRPSCYTALATNGNWTKRFLRETFRAADPPVFAVRNFFPKIHLDVLLALPVIIRSSLAGAGRPRWRRTAAANGRERHERRHASFGRGGQTGSGTAAEEPRRRVRPAAHVQELRPLGFDPAISHVDLLSALRRRQKGAEETNWRRLVRRLSAETTKEVTLLYRCECCRGVVRSGQSMLRETIKRPDGSILREHAVCWLCHERLKEEGATFDRLANRLRPARNQPLIVADKKPPSLGGKSLVVESGQHRAQAAAENRRPGT